MAFGGRYKVIDSQGQTLRVFPTWKQAMTFKIAMGRYDWRIINLLK